MMSLSNYTLVLYQQKEVRQYKLDGFKNARKLDVGMMISCNPMMSPSVTSDEMGHNPQAPGPDKKQAHSC